MREAEEFASKDKEKKAIIEAKNDADTSIYSTEKSLNDHKENIPQVHTFSPLIINEFSTFAAHFSLPFPQFQDVIDYVNSAISDLKKVMENENATTEEIREKTNLVTQASLKIGEAINKKSGTSAGPSEKEQTTEAEYEDVAGKDKK